MTPSTTTISACTKRSSTGNARTRTVVKSRPLSSSLTSTPITRLSRKCTGKDTKSPFTLSRKKTRLNPFLEFFPIFRLDQIYKVSPNFKEYKSSQSSITANNWRTIIVGHNWRIYVNCGTNVCVSSHNDDERFWSDATVDDWAKEMAGMRIIAEKFANLTDNSVVGVRAPYLRVGGNNQFTMMEEQAFLYDSTITAALNNPPLWPYTMYFRMPHRCHGNLQHCPTR